MSEPIRARIFQDEDGVDCCEAEGITARHNAPVLELCRLLIRGGLDPSRPLEAFRGPVLCLTVSSIGWGAKHTVEENETSGPTLRRRQKSRAKPDAPVIRRELTAEQEFAIASKLSWQRHGTDWILRHGRRVVGRIVPDEQAVGMFRSTKPGGRLSRPGNLTHAKSAAAEEVTRELAWELLHPPR